MRRSTPHHFGSSTPRTLVALALVSTGATLGVLAVTGAGRSEAQHASDKAIASARSASAAANLRHNPFININRLLASYGLPVEGGGRHVAPRAPASSGFNGPLRPVTSPF